MSAVASKEGQIRLRLGTAAGYSCGAQLECTARFVAEKKGDSAK
jgi:hypothetical protein